jgi:hypothetical protein
VAKIINARNLARDQSASMRDEGTPFTNMIFMSLSDAFHLTQTGGSRNAKHGLKLVVGTWRFRLVTHYWIGDAAVDKTILAFRELGE